MLFKNKKIKIGLALGSGGPRGLAHIGIIKALVKNNIPIDYIAGSSAGGIVGGFYAATKNITEIEEFILKANRRKILSLFFDPSLKQGLVIGNKLEKFIEKYIDKINFSDLKIPFIAVATDLITKESVLINKGKVSRALRISGSIPGFFKPIKKGKHTLVDGGLSTPVPVDIVRNMGADLVIAINLNDYSLVKNKVKFGFYKIINNIISIFSYNLSRSNVKHADFVVSAETQGVDWHTTIIKNKRKEVILANQKLMERLMPKLKKLINEKIKTV
jgi:NTE family protein